MAVRAADRGFLSRMSGGPVIGVLSCQDGFPPVGRNPGDDMVRDGQRRLFGQFPGLASASWRTVDRYHPGTWIPSFPPALAAMHPKRFWPLWAFWPVRGNRLAACDLLVNASGPLMFAGRTFHSLVEPWALLLPRVLRAPGAPSFLNLAFGTNFSRLACDERGRAVPPGQKLLARRLCGAAALTTCRDGLASRIMASCRLPHETLPCPSLFAAAFHAVRGHPQGFVALNFHPKGNRSRHEREVPDFPWIEAFRGLVARLRAGGHRLRFVFHEAAEEGMARQWLDVRAGEGFLPKTNAEFLRAYAAADAAVTCRVHGVYAAASCGVPAIGIGSDSRLLMVDLLGLPRFHCSRVTADELHAALRSLLEEAAPHRRRLLALVSDTEQRYLELLQPLLSHFPCEPK